MAHLSDKQIASMMATQTAIIATLCNLLISKGVLSHADIVKDFCGLLSTGSLESPEGMAPLKHLLSILETSKTTASH